MRFLEKFIPIFSWLCGAVMLIAISSITGYLLLKGLKTINLQLIFGTTDPLAAISLRQQVFDGLFPAIIGTLSLVIISVSWAIPVGLATGIYLAEYAQGRTKMVFNLFFDILAGIPSIIIGLFGFSLILFLNKKISGGLRPCLLTSSIALAVLILPYIIRTTQMAIESLPIQSRITALALGATRLQNIIHVLLPQAFSGIISGVILAIGRCAEDTVVIMLTGVVASAGVPRSLLSSYEALPFHIYSISSQYADQHELATGYGAAILLLGSCLFLFTLAFLIKKGVRHQSFYQP